MKDCGIGCKSFRENESNKKKKKVKDSRDYMNHCFGKDFQGRYSWPSRSYTCNFCKREFRSAQALGGHMNVHRRDRARLNQSPLWDGPYPDLNPIFKSTRLPSFTHPFPSLLSSSPTHLSSQTCASSGEKSSAIEASLLSILNSKSGDSMEMKTMKALYGVGELQSFMQEDECKILKKAKIVRLDSEMGLQRDSKGDLDLELRLGYC